MRPNGHISQRPKAPVVSNLPHVDADYHATCKYGVEVRTCAAAMAEPIDEP